MSVPRCKGAEIEEWAGCAARRVGQSGNVQRSEVERKEEGQIQTDREKQQRSVCMQKGKV